MPKALSTVVMPSMAVAMSDPSPTAAFAAVRRKEMTLSSGTPAERALYKPSASSDLAMPNSMDICLTSPRILRKVSMPPPIIVHARAICWLYLTASRTEAPRAAVAAAVATAAERVSLRAMENAPDAAFFTSR